MSSNSSNPILSQIPLIVSPGSFQKPKAVTLPYDFEQLPTDINDFKNLKVHQSIAELKALLVDQQEFADKINLNYCKNDKKFLDNDESVAKFKEWEAKIRMMAPGYFSQDGSVGVMTPTKHIRSSSSVSETVDRENTKNTENTKITDTLSSSVERDLAGLRID